jgi:hypothetical protein
MLQRILRVFLFAATTFAVVGFSYVALRLMVDPHPIDPAEVQVLAGAQRIVDGGVLYEGHPASSERPLMPGYPYAVSVLVREFGPDLWWPRLVALVSTMLIGALVLIVVRLETSSWTLATASVGISVMGLGVLAGFPGTALPHSVMLLLVMLAFLVLRLTKGWLATIPAAVLLSAAFFVEQSAGWFLAAALVATAPEGRARFFTLFGTASVAIAGGYVGLSEVLGPWFNFAAVDGPLQAMRFSILAPLDFVGDQLLGKLGVPTLAAVLSFAMPTEPWRGKGGLWMWMGFGGLAAGLAATQNSLAGPESVMPVVVALALLGPISMQRITRHLSSWPGSSRLGGHGVVLAALALQFIVFLSTVTWSRWLPDPGHDRGSERSSVSALPGSE